LSFQIREGRQVGDEPLGKWEKFVRKVWQDIVGKDAVTRGVEQLPARPIQAIACRFEMALCLEDATQVLGVDRDHEPRTGKTATVVRA
jgi:hypothetical protein